MPISADYDAACPGVPWLIGFYDPDLEGYWWNAKGFQPAPKIWVAKGFLNYVLCNAPTFRGGVRWWAYPGYPCDGHGIMLHYEGPQGKFVWELVWPPVQHPIAENMRLAVWPD